MSPRNIAFVATLASGILLDQLTKAWARAAPTLQVGDGWAVHDMLLHLVHRENPGAAFSLFAGLPENLRIPLFLALNVVAVVVGIIVLRGATHDRWSRGLWVGCFLSGALGNAVDRVTQGTVTDFVRFHIDYEPVYGWLVHLFGRADWPVFNIADALLLIGVAALAIGDRRDNARDTPTSETSDAATA